MKLNRFFYLFLLGVIVWSCKNDDNSNPDIVVVPPKTLAEAATADDATIKAYLDTHFYNYEEFENPPADFDFRIKFDTISGDNAGKTPLMSQITTKTILVSSSEFGRTDEENDISHTLYYLEAREGVGENPEIGDNTVVYYEGLFLNGNMFDASTSVPFNQNLSRVVRGYGNAITYFKTGNNPVENGDGTVSFTEYSVGAIFIPSGLAYFQSNSSTSIPAYTPLIFKVGLLAYEPKTDLDGDGIPSINEDLDNDGNLNNDNTDGDQFPNHFDTDDDNDGILTKDEIEVDTEGNITYPDSDNDGTPDYLDSDS